MSHFAWHEMTSYLSNLRIFVYMLPLQIRNLMHPLGAVAMPPWHPNRINTHSPAVTIVALLKRLPTSYKKRNFRQENENNCNSWGGEKLPSKLLSELKTVSEFEKKKSAFYQTEYMKKINISAEPLLVSFHFPKMYPSWLIPNSQVKEWWRVELRRRVALVQAEAPSRTPHQLIRISWLGLYNVTSPASSLSSDHSCCCWLCWFISLAFEHHAAMISSQAELVIRSPAACFPDFSQSQLGSSLHTPEGFIVSVDFTATRLDSSSRAKPFLNEYKYESIILNMVWLCTALEN